MRIPLRLFFSPPAWHAQLLWVVVPLTVGDCLLRVAVAASHATWAAGLVVAGARFFLWTGTWLLVTGLAARFFLPRQDKISQRQVTTVVTAIVVTIWLTTAVEVGAAGFGATWPLQTLIVVGGLWATYRGLAVGGMAWGLRLSVLGGIAVASFFVYCALFVALGLGANVALWYLRLL